MLFSDSRALGRRDGLVDCAGPGCGVLCVGGVEGEVERLVGGHEGVEGALDVGVHVVCDGDDEEG